MRKLCALLLLTLSAWLLVAPFAVAPAEQSLLPACCRRLGTHHCMQGSAMAQTLDRQHAGFRSAGCMLMPHKSLAVIKLLPGVLLFASLSFLACWTAFSSTSALEGFPRAVSLKSPRGPPAFYSLEPVSLLT